MGRMVDGIRSQSIGLRYLHSDNNWEKTAMPSHWYTQQLIFKEDWNEKEKSRLENECDWIQWAAEGAIGVTASFPLSICFLPCLPLCGHCSFLLPCQEGKCTRSLDQGQASTCFHSWSFNSWCPTSFHCQAYKPKWKKQLVFLFSKIKHTETPHTTTTQSTLLLAVRMSEGLLTAKTPRTTQPWCCRRVLPYALSWKD